MTTPTVAPSTGANGNAIQGTAGTQIGNISAQLGPNGFLNLMMVQLTHQDPTSPTDPTQYLGELAQFSQVEQMTTTAQSTAQAATIDAVAQAVGMIGHTVSYINQTTGATVTGAVQSVQISTSGPTLTIGGVAGIPPSSVSSVA